MTREILVAPVLWLAIKVRTHVFPLKILPRSGGVESCESVLTVVVFGQKTFRVGSEVYPST